MQTSHTYTISGSVTIKLGVKNAAGTEATTTRTITVGGGGQTYQVTITVYDENDNVIEGAEVQLLDNMTYTNRTDAEGKVFFRVAPDTYNLVVSFEGYKLYEYTWTISATSNKAYDAVLTPSLDITMLVIGIVIAIIIATIFLGVSFAIMPPFKYIIIIVGVVVAVVLFYLIVFMDIFASLMG
jgi:hypothetical protein